MSERLNLVVEDGIGDLMTALAGGPRSRGQWLSEIVRALHEGEELAQAAQDLDAIRKNVGYLSGQVHSLEGELQAMRSQLAEVIAKTANL